MSDVGLRLGAIPGLALRILAVGGTLLGVATALAAVSYVLGDHCAGPGEEPALTSSSENPHYLA